MKKRLVFLMSVLCILLLVGCSTGKSNGDKETIEGNIKTYCKLADGTWTCDELSYQYRLEITGRMPNAAQDSTFTYLSNRKNISFEQAWRASGLSSNSKDYFDVKDAVLVAID